jgi:hypothetical protein
MTAAHPKIIAVFFSLRGWQAAAGEHMLTLCIYKQEAGEFA